MLRRGRSKGALRYTPKSTDNYAWERCRWVIALPLDANLCGYRGFNEVTIKVDEGKSIVVFAFYLTLLLEAVE
jgi:hypothetical protein